MRPPSRRRVPLSALVLGLACPLLGLGCEERIPPPGQAPRDQGPDGSIFRDVGMESDAPDFHEGGALGDSATHPDLAMAHDAGASRDAGIVRDLGSPLPDLGIVHGAAQLPAECFGAGGALDLCACLVSADCSSEACPAGTRCEADGCGGQRCVRAGHPCVDDTDCPPGGRCEDSAAGRSCRSPAPHCREDRECPLGFACESRTCVDRRVPCDNSPFSCPLGFVCDVAQQQVQAFCRRVDVACEHDETCPQPGACFDLDGDGQRECVPEALRCVPSLCEPDGRICGAQPEEKGYTCGFLGSCAEQDCPTPLVCVDFAGDGRPFCTPPGSCDQHRNCPPLELCAVPHLEMSPRCVGPLAGGSP